MPSKQWLENLWKNKLTKRQRSYRMTRLKQYAEKSFPNDSCFTPDWVIDILIYIDKLYYNKLLLKTVNQAYKDGLIVSIDDSQPLVGGYVEETSDRTSISLHMNRKLFVSLFKGCDAGRAYHAGGLLCYAPLECLLNVFLHETVHIALTVGDKLGLRPDNDHHGNEFNLIIKNLFGQTNWQHGLIPGLTHNDDLQQLKEKLKRHEAVNAEVFVEGKWYTCKIVQTSNEDWVKVRISGERKTISVNPGLIRFKA